MKVRIQLADRSGCGHHRGLWPAQALEDTLDTECTEMMDTQKFVDQRTGQVVKEKPRNIDCDVIVLQRPMELRHIMLIPELRKQCAVVVDLDDDLTCIDPKHPAWRRFHPTMSPTMNWHLLKKACSMADMVTVSTPPLAQRFAGHGRFRVLRNCVLKEMLGMPHLGDGNTVGWAGITATHPGDLPVTRGGVAQAVEEAGARFMNIGNPDGVREQLGLHDDPETTGPLPDINDWNHELGRLDVGIIPLADTKFNESKSWLKGVEFAARGVAFVASPLPAYQELHDGGMSFLFAPPKARKWRSGVMSLLIEPENRREMVEHNKLIVGEQHTYEGNAWRWEEAWQHAIVNHRANYGKTEMAA